MAELTIILAAAFGVFMQIWQEKGYELKPYCEEGKFQLNIVLSVLIGFVSVFLAIESGLPGFETPIAAFMTAFTVPFVLEQSIKKFPKGDQKEEEKEDDMVA